MTRVESAGRLQALIFDFDGVIIDSEALWWDIYQEWFSRKVNYELTLEQFLVCVGANAQVLFDELNRGGLAVDCDRFHAEVADIFVERSMLLPAMPGVEQLLIEAKNAGLRIGLNTSATLKKPKTHLERLGLLGYFDVLVTAEDVTRIKPDPQGYLLAASKLGVEPSSCAAIEDSLHGMHAALSAGMAVIMVPNRVTRGCDFSAATAVVDSLTDCTLPS